MTSTLTVNCLSAREKDVSDIGEAWTPGKAKAKDKRPKGATPKPRKPPSSPAERISNFFTKLGTPDSRRNLKRDTNDRPSQKDDEGVQPAKTLEDAEQPK